MAKIAYFDCFSGCSGDMILGALLDTGLPLDTLKEGLSSLNIEGFKLTLEKVKKVSIIASKFNVVLTESHHHSRTLTDILQIIESSHLQEKVKKMSSAIFQRLGEVEGRIHGVPPEKVHFHEIGAIDSIIDIVGTVFAFEFLGVQQFYSSPLPPGSGQVSTEHGILPVPAPATLELLAMANAPITDPPDKSKAPGELVTPTGAALVTMLAKFSRPDMVIEKVGYGAGTREFENWPNVMRIWLGEDKQKSGDTDLILMETNIDDMNPQIYGYLMEKLFSEQAIDAWLTPIQMKKNRPATMLSVIAPSDLESRLTELLMKETTTLGIRVRPIFRHIAAREIVQIESSLGRVRVKIKKFNNELLDISPEYDDCRQIAIEKEIPLREVYRTVIEESRQLLKPD
jgi:pyridinium-3,5-bisthiocarboxylic acid mononucleotide nickel chelatase